MMMFMFIVYFESELSGSYSYEGYIIGLFKRIDFCTYS